MKLNPYIAGNPVGGGDAFIGRADVLREVVRVLRSPSKNALVLYGQRRIGKTSILQHLIVWLPQEGPYHAVYFDLQDKATWSLGRVLVELAQTVAQSLGQPSPDLGADPETTFYNEWLPTILSNLPDEASLVLLFDEFDVLAGLKSELAAAAFFPYVRNLIASNPQRLNFVFVIGRNVEDLANIALSVFKGIPSYRVSLLNREDTSKLVCLAQANHSLDWPDDVVEQVWQLTSGHPFLTQQLCDLVWEQVYEKRLKLSAKVTAADIEAAVPGALESARNALEWLWQGLPPAGRVVASALAQAGSELITQEELERLLYESGVQVIIRELQTAPLLLQDWDLIETIEGGYRFRVELLRRWIVERKPLNRVQAELDRINPLAESYFQTGYGHYQNGEFDQAVPQLRGAINLNPMHLQANELLTEILLAQDKIAEALQLLESLREYYPTVVIPRLVQTLLRQAQLVDSDEERANLYEQVLELDPNQPEAGLNQALTLARLGDRALAESDLEKAFQFFSRAKLPEKTLAVELLQLQQYQVEKKHQQALKLTGILYDKYPHKLDSLPKSLLAEVLLGREKIAEALQQIEGFQEDSPEVAQPLLERLYQAQPKLAGPLLVKTILYQAKVTKDENEQLTLYEKILSIEPGQPDALNERRQIWKKRGDEALIDGEFELAREAYQQAGLFEKVKEVELQMRRHYFDVGLEKVSQLERAEKFQDALALATKLRDEYPQEQGKLPDLNLLENKSRLPDLYQQALTALEKGEQQTAQSLLTQVVALELNYHEATRYLYQAATGIDPIDLQRKLESEKQIRQTWVFVSGVAGTILLLASLSVALFWLYRSLYPAMALTMPTLTPTLGATSTPTPSMTAALRPGSTPPQNETAPFTPTPIDTPTLTPTNTLAPTVTPTNTPWPTPTNTLTSTPLNIFTSTATPILTVVATFDNSIELSVLDQPQKTTYHPGDPVTIWLRWKAKRQLKVDYKASVQLLGPNGQINIYGQKDEYLVSENKQTSQWEPGRWGPSTHQVNIAPDAPAGQYYLAVAIFNPGTNERLAPKGNVKIIDNQDMIVLQEINVVR